MIIVSSRIYILSGRREASSHRLAVPWWRHGPRLIAIMLLQRVMQSPDDVAVNEAFLKSTYHALS